MTNQEIKRIEDQIADLQSIVKKYYKDQTATEIIKKEDELLGKAFKETEDGVVTYFKPMSMIDVNAPHQCQGLRFKLPLKLDFTPRARLRMVMNSEFDYIYYDDLILYMDTEYSTALGNGGSYEEISEEEFDAALANLMYQTGEISKKYHTIKLVYGSEYDTKIRNLIREGEINEEEKKE